METLMENAGWAVASVVERDFGSGLRIAVLCGCGNNGGDGFVTARHLKERNDVDVMLARPPNFIKKQVAWSNYEKVQEISMLWRKGCLEGYDLLIDALLGVRTVGTPREPFGEIIQEMNASGIPIVSVDIPSGLGSEFMVRPRTTVTFHDLKEGMDGGELRQDCCRGHRDTPGGRDVLWSGRLRLLPYPGTDDAQGRQRPCAHSGRGAVHRGALPGGAGMLPVSVRTW